MSIKSKLIRMKKHLQTETNDKKESTELEKDSSSDEIPHETLSLEDSFSKLGFVPFYFDGERSYRKRVVYTYDQKRDKALLRSMTKLKDFWSSDLTTHPLSFHGKSTDRLLFFDTETTGLSTGAGNVIFLIGYARLKAEGIEVTQHLLESPSNEAAFLSGFLEDFAEDDYLVTYNGKSFDWPQVKSRHAFIRKELPKLPEFGHIDLLHSARRLWKHELPSCRLSIVEEEKLHISRENDTPGSLAPLLYFDYLHEKDPHHLAGIIKHNDQDVRSLAYLYEQIAMKIIFSSNGNTTSMEHYYIGDWFEKLGNYEWAFYHYEQSIERSSRPFSQAYYRLGLLNKKLGNKQEAIRLLSTSLHQTTFPPLEAWIELSKLAEHYEKDMEKAIYYAKEASSQLKKTKRMTQTIRKRQEANLNKRLNRLEQKFRK
ncbi:ribonuclease H-like domain-containing protein [Salipaludibacillus daqingensis]|uniref:ribonuclease H-like domain-containing protein n=1 Tax=Salipaludibacillus daqingensis TaxID=3041001 RepID=UPI00247509AD|nr:ribonuclease H-like domain-containing protein [Salipaludibacillus daqingensis]